MGSGELNFLVEDEPAPDTPDGWWMASLRSMTVEPKLRIADLSESMFAATRR